MTKFSLNLQKQQLLVALVFVVILFVVLWQTAALTRAAAIEEIRHASANKLTLFISNLTSELEKYEFLPQVLARDEKIIRLLRDPSDAAHIALVNRYLEKVNKIAGASDTYVIDKDGLTLVASNWDSQTPFVGQNFSFRPYFQAAMRGEVGRYYALGTTSKRRGYYYASPIKLHNEILGAAVVKISPENVEAAWHSAPEKVIVTDYNGVVFITNNPSWKFRTAYPLTDTVLQQIKQSRQYSDAVTSPLPIIKEQLYANGVSLLTFRESTDEASGKEVSYLTQSREMPSHRWLVHLLADTKAVDARVAYSIGYATVSVITICLVLLYVLQRRRNLSQRLQHQKHIEETLLNAQKELEVQVKQRTVELIETNEQLDNKIKEQEKTEQELRKAQEELLQSAKLAVVGQMSAGITHELNQPLTAIQTYIGTARQLLKYRNFDELSENLANVLTLTDRMARFTSQLKTFSRKSTQNISAVSLNQAINDALMLVTHTHNQEIDVIEPMLEQEIFVLADAVRLEQVFVNIFKNGVDAMKDSGNRELTISMQTLGDSVTVRIGDSGSGIPEENLGKLFDPFFTSKEVGAGLGLGLSISREIVNEFGGSITASNQEPGGALFTVTFPTVMTDGACASTSASDG
jgi:two-component system C4-dicarboxylate transport sensor histidine kinase DctB